MRNLQASNYIEVMAKIPDQAIIATTSFGIGGMPEQLFAGLGEYYRQHQSPRAITFISTAGLGMGEGRGLDHLIVPGLLKRVVSSYLFLCPLAEALARQDAYELFMLPQGIIGQLYQNAAQRGPGVFSQVGLDTFIDPRLQAGQMNPSAQAQTPYVSTCQIDGQPYLHYRPLNFNVAFIKGTFADRQGNISLKHETNRLEQFSLAAGAKNAGGLVIAQVEEIIDKKIPAHEVVVPGHLVDEVVIGQSHYHQQTSFIHYSPYLSNEQTKELSFETQTSLTIEDIILRRAASELPDYSLVNIGNGLASRINRVIGEQGLLDRIKFAIDFGGYGGYPCSGYDYGPSINAEAILASQDMFSLFHGGGLDATILGFGQLDPYGNMNSTLLGGKIYGPGGMIDITHGAQKIIFIGEFRQGEQVELVDQQVRILHSGNHDKFVKKLVNISFASGIQLNAGKEIMVITSRAVFDLDRQGKLRLIEIAPGLDLEQDILQQLSFQPVISPSLKKMDSSLFDLAWQHPLCR